MNVILHSTNCPKCNILEKKLTDKNIDFIKNENVDIDKMISMGYTTAPILQIDDIYMEFSDANRWINEQ